MSKQTYPCYKKIKGGEQLIVKFISERDGTVLLGNSKTKSGSSSKIWSPCTEDIWEDVSDEVAKELDPYYKLNFEDEPVENDMDNNGGTTDYYAISPEWKSFQDVIEARDMNYAQGNIFKIAGTFNIGRHDGTDALRDINKVLWFAKRIKDKLLKDSKC